MSTNAEGMAADPTTAVRAQTSLGLGVVNQENTRTVASTLSDAVDYKYDDDGSDNGMIHASARKRSVGQIERGSVPVTEEPLGQDVDSGAFTSVPYERLPASLDELWDDVPYDPARYCMQVCTWRTRPVRPLGRGALEIEAGPRREPKCPIQVRRADVDRAVRLLGTAMRPLRQKVADLSARVHPRLTYANVAQGSEKIVEASLELYRQSIVAHAKACNALRPACPVKPVYQHVTPDYSELMETTGGEYGCTVNKTNRKWRPKTMTTYCLPTLGRIGFSESARNVDASGYIRDGYIRYEDGGGYLVELPAVVVNQTMAWLANKPRTEAVQRLCYVKVSELSRDLDLTPTELVLTNWLCPLVAWATTEGISVTQGALLSRNYVGRSLVTKIAMTATLAALCLPTAAAASVSGIAATAVLPVAAVGAALLVGAGAMCAAWVTGNAKPAMGPAFEPPRFTSNSRATKPASTKPGAKYHRKDDGGLKLQDSDAVKPCVTPVGFCDSNYVPIALAANALNEEKALDARVMASTPRPDPETAAAFVAFVKSEGYKIFGNKGRPFKIKPLPFDTWLKGVKCSEHVRDTYAAVKGELFVAGYDENSQFDKSTLYRFTTRKAFVKLETTLHREHQKAPRLIQGAQPQMTVLVGPWMSAFQGYLKSRLSTTKSNLVFSSGVDQREIADFIGEWDGTAKYTEDDVSAYDASIGRYLGELEIWICKQFGAPRAVLDLMSANLSTHGYTRCGFFYEVDGTRKSGDVYTSCLNTLLNLLMHAFIYCKMRPEPKTWEEVQHQVRIVAMGDDDVIVDKANLDIDWKHGMRCLGFDSKPIERQFVDQVEYCSHVMMPTKYIDGPGWALVYKLGRLISKSSVSLRVTKAEDRLRILRGTALSVVGSVSCSPPHMAFVQKLLELTRGVSAISPEDEPWKMTASHAGSYTDETGVALNRRYGWDPQLQVLWEEELATVNQACRFYELPICASFQAKDSDSPIDGVMTSAEHNGVPTNAAPSAPSTVSIHSAEYNNDDVKREIPEPDSDGAVYIPRRHEVDQRDPNSSVALWSISSKDRNAEQHALNGNTCHNGHMLLNEDHAGNAVGRVGMKHFVNFEFSDASSMLTLRPVTAVAVAEGKTLRQIVTDYGLLHDPEAFFYYKGGRRLSLDHPCPVGGDIHVNDADDFDYGDLDEKEGVPLIAHIKIGDHIYKDGIRFSPGTLISNILEAAFVVPVDFSKFDLFLDGKPVHLIDECYPSIDSFIVLRPKGLGGVQCFVELLGQDAVVVDKVRTVADAVYAAEERLEMCGVAQFHLLNISVNGRPATANDVVPDEANITVDVKGLGGSGLVAVVFALIQQLRPAVSDAAIHVAAEQLVNIVLNDIESHGDERKEDSHTFSLNGKTHVFETDGTMSYSQIVSQHAGVALGALHSCNPWTGSKMHRWHEIAKSDFDVRIVGMGGSSGISRAEKILDRLMATTGVLQSSRGSVLCACDGFHDRDERWDGWPSADTSSSVTECIKVSTTVVSAQGTTALWDANIIMNPDMVVSKTASYINVQASGVPTNSYFAVSAGSTGIGLTTYNQGGIAVQQGVTGSTLNVTNTSNSIACLPTQATSGAARVCGYAIEVINNTAPLYQQGTITVWRQPMPVSTDATVINVTTVPVTFPSTTAYTGSVSALLTPEAPSTVAEALLLNGSRQWHAKEGAMVVATMNSDSNPIINNQCIATILYPDSPTDASVYLNNPIATLSQTVATAPTTASTLTNGLAWGRTFLAPFNMSGVYLTGLSPQTSLTVNVRTYVEIFPSQIGNPLTPLAQPSAPYDPAALALISELMRGLPPGVMLCENGFGDFFSDMVGKIGSFLSPVSKAIGGIARMIPHPIAQGIGQVAGVVEGLTGQTMPASEQAYNAPGRDLVRIDSQPRMQRERSIVGRMKPRPQARKVKVVAVSRKKKTATRKRR